MANIRNWLALLIVSALAVIPVLPYFRATGSTFILEYEVVCSDSGYAQVYWDYGQGYAEKASQRLFFKGGTSPQKIQFRLPQGDLRQLRLDPNDRPADLVLRDVRLADPDGETVREFRQEDLVPLQQIKELQSNSEGISVRFEPQANDPQLNIAFEPALRLRTDVTSLFKQWLRWSLGCALTLILARLIWARLPVLERRGKRIVQHWQEHPRRGLAWMALVASLLATYPIFILNRSYVSPHSGGVPLLYESMPTVPGGTSNVVTSVHGSDVGAMMWHHIPYSRLHRGALLSAEMPLWNRYNATGVPMIGQGQSMFGDPLLWPLSLAGGASWAWDLRFVAARWLLSFGLGWCTWLVVRHLVAAHVVTFAAAFIGFFLYRFNHPAVLTLGYAPWVLLGWLLLTEAKRPRELGLALFTLALANMSLLNSGTVKEAYMLVLMMNASGLFYCILNLDTWSQRLRRLAAAAVALLAFMLLSAPTWLLFLHQLQSSYTSYNQAHTFQIQPGVALGFFDELFYRPLSQEQRVFNPSLNFVFLAGIAYFVATLRDHLNQKRTVAIAVAALGPLALAFGLVPPEWIVATPFLGNVAHVDNTFSCGAIILLAIVAGSGFASAGRRLATPEGKRDLLLAAVFVGVLVWSWIAFRQSVHRSVFGPGITFSAIHSHDDIPVLPFVWWNLLLLPLAIGAAGLLIRGALRTGIWTYSTKVSLALCVFACLWRLGSHGEYVGFPEFTTTPGPRVHFAGTSKAVQAIKADQATEPSRAVGLKSNLFPGWNAYYEIEGISSPEAVINPYLRELITASPLTRIWDWRLYTQPDEVAKARPFLDLLNVRYIADYMSDQGLLGQTLQPVALVDLDVYESPSYWPRAYFTNRVFSYQKPEELVATLLARPNELAVGVQASDLGKAEYTRVTELVGSTPGTWSGTPAHDYLLEGNSTSFTVTTSGPGVVVLTEAWNRDDFRAEIDQVETPVLRVNHAFRGVTVPAAGTYRVNIWYHPRGYTTALILFGSGVVLSLILTFSFRRFSTFANT